MDVTSPLDLVRETLEKSLFGGTVSQFAAALEHRPGHRGLGEELCGYALAYAHHAYPDTAPEVVLRGHFQRFVMAYLEEYKNFKKTFRYSKGKGDFDDINRTIYQNTGAMEPYLLSLLVSYVFFPHHFEEIQFYKRCVAALPDDARCLDFGSGHGLFSLLPLQGSGRTCECVDISPTATSMTSFLLDTFADAPGRYSVTTGDATSYAPARDAYDFFICCGFLEHIENPEGFLAAYLPRLADDGRAFVMLPVNTPHPDHIIHFTAASEVDSFLLDNGLTVIERMVIPTEDVDLEQAERDAIPTVHLTLCRKAAPADRAREDTP